MAIELTADWKPSAISTGNGTFQAYLRKDSNVDGWHDFIAQNVESAVSEGGALFEQFKEPDVINEIAHPGGIIGYQYDLPKPELWYLPKCSFEQTLQLLGFFEFPSAKICAQPEQIRNLSRALVLQLAENRRLAVTRIDSETICIDKLRGGLQFTAEEVNRVLQFNQQHFGINYSANEFEDMQSNYQQKGFFVLGRM